MSTAPFLRWPSILGILLMVVLVIVEVTTHVLATVGFIAIAAYTLWLSEHPKQIFLVSISATFLLILGYILAISLEHPNDQATFFVNRVSALIVIWFAYYFTLRYRKTQCNEQTQRIELEERKLAEERLNSSFEIHKTIARNFPIGWIGILDESMKYIVADGKGLDRIGLKTMDMIGKEFSIMSETGGAQSYLKEALEGKEVSFEGVFKKRIFEIHASPFQVDQTKHWILVVVHDITTLKETEARLIRSLEKERALGEMKSQFIMMASHEFRTPLTTILSSSSLLSMYSGDKYENEKNTHIGRIKQSVKLLENILSDFLSIDTLKEGEINPLYELINLVDFLTEVAHEVDSLKGHTQMLSVRHSGEELITSDRQFLRGILHNLLSNAFKYSHPDDQILLESETTSEKLMIRVTDRGIGIPLDEQEYIFTRFFRARNASNIQGTGLGLHIAKNYIELLRGSIDFSSDLNKGSVFLVTLPFQK